MFLSNYFWCLQWHTSFWKSMVLFDILDLSHFQGTTRYWLRCQNCARICWDMGLFINIKICIDLDYHAAISYDCLNGGSLTGPQKCQCTSLFTGDHCETPICYYGGKVNPFPGNGNPLCLCPQGYSGDHCDLCKPLLLPHFLFSTMSNRARSYCWIWKCSNASCCFANFYVTGWGMLSFIASIHPMFSLTAISTKVLLIWLLVWKGLMPSTNIFKPHSTISFEMVSTMFSLNN